MKKIRVLHILDELNTGGAERIVVSYFLNIDRDKFQWDFIITKYEDSQKKGILEETVETYGGHIYRVTRKRENYFKNIREIDRIIKLGNYDIVHSHLDELSAFYLASAKRYKVPVRICHSHLSGSKRGLYIEILCKILRPLMFICSTDKFACGKDAGIALWGKKYVENHDVYIMKNAINVDKFKFNGETRAIKRKELGIEHGLLVGSVGRLSYQKNSSFLIPIFRDIIKFIPEAELVIVGEGELELEIRRLVQIYGLENRVHLLGARTDVNELMMAMDIFLLPSRFEGLPIVLVEAQCSGLCCLISDSITKEIKINDNVIYCSLKQNSEQWALEATKLFQKNSFNTNRKDSYINIKNNGFEIKSAAYQLEKYYINALEKGKSR